MYSLKLMFLLVILIVAVVKLARGCWSGGGGGGDWPTTTTKKTKATTKSILDRNLGEAWGGFDPPEKVKAKWRNYFDKYKAKQKEEAEENDSKYKKNRGPQSGWPDSWQGIGGGHPGDQPPPWAYKPINQGLPDFCSVAPVRGPCTNFVSRYAYNSYTDDCEAFSYGGCNGNQNNFESQAKCKQACMEEPVTGCDMNTTIYIDE